LHWYRKWSGCSGFDFLKHTFSWKLQRGWSYCSCKYLYC
jgi:hypothetical protein